MLDESKPIDERLAIFKDEMRAICPSDWKICANDERTAAGIRQKMVHGCVHI